MHIAGESSVDALPEEFVGSALDGFAVVTGEGA